MSLPTGIAYFVVTVFLFAVGVGTLIIGVGIPILLLLFMVSGGFLALERSLSRTLLGLELPEPVTTSEPDGLLRRLIFRAGRLKSWNGLLYLILKLPLGILSFVVAIVSIVVPLTFAAAAFLSLFLTALPIELGWGPTIYLDPLSGAAVLGLIAIVMGALSLVLVVGLTKLWEGINGVMLAAESGWAAPPAEESSAVVIS